MLIVVSISFVLLLQEADVLEELEQVEMKLMEDLKEMRASNGKSCYFRP